jgi:long-chain fatty acid transport protein
LRRALAVALVSLALAPSLARAGGFGRPNEVGARAIGLGGAFAAVADDPTAVWHNPAGLAFPDETQVLVSLGLISLDREWLRPTASGYPTFSGACTPPSCVPENTPLQLVPTLGASTRFAFGGNHPQRLALGIAFYNSYGGAISFDPKAVADSLAPGASGITSTSITLLEVTPAVAYQLADVLSVGFALRVGIGTFAVEDVEAAFSASKLSATGAGLGGSFSAMVRPHPRLQIGAVYRTTLTTKVTGGGDISIGGGMPSHRDMSLELVWPQSTSLGVSLRATNFLRLVVQGDWTGWSSVQKLDVQFSGGLEQAKAIRFSDNFTLHAGAEVTFWRLAVRAGFTADTNAVPDSAFRRENRDGMKYDATVGAGVRVGRFRIDAAFDYLFGIGAPRVISAPAPDAEAGAYRAQVLSFELSGGVAF